MSLRRLQERHCINPELIVSAEKLLGKIEKHCKGKYIYSEPFTSYDMHSLSVIIEWHLKNMSVINISKRETFYFIITDDTIKNSLDGEFNSDKDFNKFCENTFL